MKTLPTLALATTLIATPASGQTVLSAWGGATIANMDVSTTTNQRLPDGELTGTAFGVGVALPVAGPFGLRLGAAYAQKGFESTVTVEDISVITTLAANYLEFNALAMVGFGRSSLVSAYALAGPALAFESSCDLSGRDVMGGSSVDVTASCSEAGAEFHGLDFGLAGGAGLGIGLSDRLGAEVGALYTYGLRDVDESETETVRHRVVTLRAGLTYSTN